MLTAYGLETPIGAMSVPVREIIAIQYVQD